MDIKNNPAAIPNSAPMTNQAGEAMGTAGELRAKLGTEGFNTVVGRGMMKVDMSRISSEALTQLIDNLAAQTSSTEEDKPMDRTAPVGT